MNSLPAIIMIVVMIHVSNWTLTLHSKVLNMKLVHVYIEKKKKKEEKKKKSSIHIGLENTVHSESRIQFHQ